MTTPQPTISEATVPVWGGRINMRVKVAGAGAPLVYFHPAGGLTWDPFLSHLAENYTVYAPEFPGTSAGDPYAIHQVDDLGDVILIYEELVRKLGLVKPVMIGQSFGGMIASEMASFFPDLASSLVLLDPVGLWSEAYPTANWIATPAETLPELLFHDPQSPAAQAMLAMPSDPEQQRAAIAGIVWAFGCTGKFAWPIPDRGLRNRLHRISARTLIIWGREDKLADVAYANEFANAIVGSKVAIFEDCGHIPQVEKYAETTAAVDDFLA